MLFSLYIGTQRRTSMGNLFNTENVKNFVRRYILYHDSINNESGKKRSNCKWQKIGLLSSRREKKKKV